MFGLVFQLTGSKVKYVESSLVIQIIVMIWLAVVIFVSTVLILLFFFPSLPCMVEDTSFCTVKST